MLPVILAVDTSGMCGTIALRRDGELLAERELEQSRRRHAQTLISEVKELLDAHGLVSADVDIAAVSHGPGSFTGLRVGIVFAKTLAYVTGCRIAAVDTLQAIAEMKPVDAEALGHVPGVGPAKIERYADPVLELVAAAR